MRSKYDYDSAASTLAGPAPGVHLRDDDRQRLGLTRVSVEVDATPDGGSDMLEEWSDARGLDVAVVNGLIHLISAKDQAAIDGENVVGWTEQDFVRRLGPSDREPPVAL